MNGDEPASRASQGNRRPTWRHRAVALMVGVPSALLLVVPWKMRSGWTTSWDLPHGSAAPMIAIGLSGTIVLASAFTRRYRQELLLLGGLAAAASGLWLLGELPMRPTHELRTMSLMATRVWLGLAILAAGAEMAMHAYPRSQRVTRIAFLGWLALLLSFFFLPLATDLDPESAVAYAFGGHHFRYETAVPAFSWFALVALVGVVQCARRLGSDRDRAERRRFRRGWLAWLLFPVPLMLLFGFGLYLAIDSEPAMVSNVTLGFAAFFVPMTGGALGVREALEWMEGQPGVDRPTLTMPKPAVFGIGGLLAVVVVGAGLWRAFGPDPREPAIHRLAWGLGEAVEQALRGEPFDERFLGGYADLDLRAAEGVVDLPAGAEPALVALGGARGWGDSQGVWAIARDERSLVWAWRPVGADAWELAADLRTLRQAGDGFAAIVERLGEEGCVPGLEEGALGDPVVARFFPDPPEVGPVCFEGEDEDERLQSLARRRSDFRGGAVDRYVVVFAVNGSEPIAVGGRLYAHTGRAWVGAPSLWPPDEGSQAP